MQSGSGWCKCWRWLFLVECAVPGSQGSAHIHADRVCPPSGRPAGPQIPDILLSSRKKTHVGTAVTGWNSQRLSFAGHNVSPGRAGSCTIPRESNSAILTTSNTPCRRQRLARTPRGSRLPRKLGDCTTSAPTSSPVESPAPQIEAPVSPMAHGLNRQVLMAGDRVHYGPVFRMDRLGQQDSPPTRDASRHQDRLSQSRAPSYMEALEDLHSGELANEGLKLEDGCSVPWLISAW